MHTKTFALLAITATAIAVGTLSGLSEPSLLIAFIAQGLTLIAGALTYVWSKLDVSQRRVRTSTEFNGLVILATPVSLPFYFLRTRGLGRGLLATALFYLCMVGWVLLAEGSALLVWLARAA